MSADNFVAIQQVGGRWYVWSESASNRSPFVPIERATVFRFGFQARRFARKLVRDNYYEYGISELGGWDSWPDYYQDVIFNLQHDYWEMVDKFQGRQAEEEAQH